MEENDAKGSNRPLGIGLVCSVAFGLLNFWLAASLPNQSNVAWLLGWATVGASVTLSLLALMRNSIPIHAFVSALTVVHLLVRYPQPPQYVSLLQFVAALFLTEVAVLNIEGRRSTSGREEVAGLTMLRREQERAFQLRLRNLTLFSVLAYTASLLLALVGEQLPTLMNSVYWAIVGSTALVVVLVFLAVREESMIE